MIEAEAMVELLQSIGHEPFAYSGRAMYGHRCVAVRLDEIAELFRMGADLAVSAEGTQHSSIPTPLVDTLGGSVVAYWRDLRWPG